MVVLYWIAFLASLFNAKIIGAEMMGVLQVSFIGMTCLDSRSSSIVRGSYLRYSDGWNPLFNKIGIPNSSARLAEMGLRSVFLSDYNLMLVVILLPPLVALCMFCAERVRLSKKLDETNGATSDTFDKARLIRNELLTDYILTIALVSTYGVVFAFAINLVNITEANLSSTIFGAVMMCALLGIAVYYAVKKNKFL